MERVFRNVLVYRTVLNTVICISLICCYNSCRAEMCNCTTSFSRVWKDKWGVSALASLLSKNKITLYQSIETCAVDSKNYPIHFVQDNPMIMRVSINLVAQLLKTKENWYLFCSQDLSASPEVLEEYMGLEKAIWREEQQVLAPAPALSFATVRLEALNTELQAAEQSMAMWNNSGGSGSDDSLRQVVLELGIHRNEERAAEHEEFIATINRQVQTS